MKKGMSTKILVYAAILVILALLGFALIFKGKEIGLDIVERIKELLSQKP
jgi:hypothetical protein